MTRSKWKIAAVCVGVALLSFLLLPAASRKHAIVFNESELARKEEYLEGLSETTARSDERPNIVLIVADDLGEFDLSSTGSRIASTPNIDRIGSEGVVFTNAYCSSSICAPSRASMLTGRYQQRFGFELQPNSRYAANRLEYFIFKHLLDIGFWRVADLEVPKRVDRKKQGVPPTELMVSELLDASGYRTGIIGKWHLGAGEGFIPNSRGFDYQYGFYEAFTLYADPKDPDIVNNPIDEFSDRHQWSRKRKGTSAIRINDEVIEEDGYLTDKIADRAIDFIRDAQNERFFAYIPFSAPHVPFQVPAEYVRALSGVEDRTVKVYNAMIHALDDAVGKVLDELDGLGIAGNTLVIFASDNGGAFFNGSTENGPLKGGKFTNFDGGLRVPLFIRWPGKIERGSVFEHQVALFDIYATVAAAADLEPAAFRQVDGVDLIPHINSEETAPPHEFLFWKTLYNKAVRRGRWKLIVNEYDSTTMLFDTVADPGESTDLFKSQPEIAMDLTCALAAWEEGLVAPLWPRVMDVEFTIDGRNYRFAI